MLTNANLHKSAESAASDTEESNNDAEEYFDDGYDEDFMGNEEDRQQLALMTERQREIILYNRAQRREALLARFTVRQKLLHKKSHDETNDAIVKRKTTSVLNEESKVKSTESVKPNGSVENEQSTSELQSGKRKETPHSYALDRLIAERKRKKLEKDNANDEVLTSSQSSSNPSDDLDNADQNENSDDSDDDSSSRDSDDNLHPSSDNESNADFETEAEHQRKATTYISCKEELIRIRLSRHKLAKWCHAPFFREVALGSFVRVGVGIANSDPVYRIAEIVDISTLNKPYEFEGTKTDKGVKLRHSNSERLFRMSFISNSTFTDREFDRWVYTLRKQNQTLPTIEQMELKESIIKHYMQYVYLDDDVEQIVKEKSRLKILPTNFAVARTDLRAQLDVAIANKNNYEIERLENELQELDKQSAELRKDEQLARLDEINKRNRQSTLDNVEAALMLYAEEKKDAKPDPFTRRRCLPQIVTKSKNQNLLQKHESSTTSADTLDITSLQNKYDDLSAVSVLTPNDTVIPENYDTSDIDLFSMHNFDVDITIPQFEDSIIQQPTAVNGHFTFQNIYSTGEASTQQKSLDITNNQAMDTTIDGQATIKKPLNLDEYRRRRGLL